MSAAGWTWLVNSRKWHYFPANGNTSLCGFMVLKRPPDEDFEDDNHESSDNCAECKRKRLKLMRHQVQGVADMQASDKAAQALNVEPGTGKALYGK